MYKSELLAVRPGVKDDEAFIYRSWLLSLYYGDSWASIVPKDLFMECYHSIIESMLTSSTVRIACLKESPNVIVGFAVVNKDEDAVHYVYCKDKWRKIGVAKMLIGDKIKTATNLSDMGRSYVKSHKDWVFNPFILGEYL